MSRNRIKSLDFDDDDYYDEDEYDDGGGEGEGIYDGSEEMSVEDRERMRLGTLEVKELLSLLEPPVAVSNTEIQEALWNYYWDVDQSVDHLKKKKTPAPKKQPKKTPKATSESIPSVSFYSRVCAGWADRPYRSELPEYPVPGPYHVPFSTRDFFRDSPWLNVPLERKADILVEPLYRGLGLLGGNPEASGKSKLAALAATRKKKLAESASTGDNGKLSLGQRLATNKKDNERPRQQSPRPIDTSKDKPVQAAMPQKLDTSSVNKAMESLGIKDQVKPEEHRAKPSTFAITITGDSPQYSQPKRMSHSIDVTSLFGQNLTSFFNFSEPSPDDVILSARNTSKGNKATKPAPKKPEQVVEDMEKLALHDTKIKSKNLNVLDEFKKAKKRKAANFVVIGHVDAGKSTLMGRLLFELKHVDQRTLDKYRKEAERIGKGSFAWAWVTDQASEERARGVTIDIATNKFETDSTSFTILDAPGHRDFVPNMIAGASLADFAVLVIDAGTGNFEAGLKGQTKEHALLVRSIGTQKIVVAVNKMDAINWSKDRFDEISQQTYGFLTTAGFQTKNISIIPCSGISGGNIVQPLKDANASWYHGNTLIQELDCCEPYSYAVDKPLRMTISDVFRGGIQNPLSISGRIDAGSLQVGDQIIVMPSEETAGIKGLEVDQEPADWAVAGHNVVLHLAHIDPAHLRSGDIICSPASPIRNVTFFTAKVLAFEHLTPMHLDVHRGRLYVPGRISKLVGTLDKANGEIVKKRPKIVLPGTVARVVVELGLPIPLEAPGRVVLRAEGQTVAAGLLEKAT